LTAGAPVRIGGDQLLTVDDVIAVARERRQVMLDESCRGRVHAARSLIETIASGNGRPTYGVDTGFGDLSRVRITHDDLIDLQHNLVRSHAAAVGDPLPAEGVRAMMLLLANNLAKGHSGVRLQLIERIVTLLNKKLTPVVPSRGSVGASGDLAPLAHIALSLIGGGQLERDGVALSSAEVLAAEGLEPERLASKEGLALINGTHLMAGVGALLVHDAKRLLEASELAAALTLDSLLCSLEPMDDRIHALRRRSRQRQVAAHMRALVAGSELHASHAHCERVQDPYSIRCIPQVLGAAWEAFDYVSRAISVELDAVTDNPLCFADDGDVISGGNFHGQPLSLPLDTLALMSAEVAAFSERRSFRLLSDGGYEQALPPFLTTEPGTKSGLMIIQYVAASLVAENQVLASPAGTASLPTSGGQEDYNSLGATAALKARQVIDNALLVVAVELIAGAQAIDLRRPLRTGPVLEQVHATVRELSQVVTDDRSLSADIEAVAASIRSGAFRQHTLDISEADQATLMEPA
jgi:histidine ammonia-lyase